MSTISFQPVACKSVAADVFGDRTTAPQATTLVAHPAFAATLAQVVACAHAKMPEAQGRITRAADLLPTNQVRRSTWSPGRWVVDSASRDHSYDVVENVCNCYDYDRHAPTTNGYACKHVISVWLYRRTEERLAELDATPTTQCWAPIDEDGTPCHATQEDCIHEPAWSSESSQEAQAAPAEATPSTPAATGCGSSAGLPEAPASVNVRLTVHGREVQFTLRDTDELHLLERLEALLARFPVEAKPVTPTTPEQGWCTIHSLSMRLNEKEGRTWYSHKIGDTWCKGKAN